MAESKGPPKKKECGCKCLVCHFNTQKYCTEKWSMKLSELEDSAPGCDSCSLLAETTRSIVGDYNEVLVVPRRDCAFEQPVRFLLSLRNLDDSIRWGDYSWEGSSWELFGLPSTDQPNSYATLLPSNLVSRDTSSAASFDTAQRWLDKCISKHGRCGANIDQKQTLPNRIIDVGPPDSKGTVKLVETQGNQQGAYVCLSHCWGMGARPFRTTKRNLEQQTQGIQESDLTKTFQDAIDFVRRLGMRYLWIDSLCIVQDDKDDWMLHAKSMAGIYENAHLTLSASFGADGTAGCYSSSARDFETTLIPGQPPNRPVYRRMALRHFWDGPRSQGWAPDNVYYPLLSRAWVYQERVLSPRVVHFGVGELLWECKEEYACECTDGIVTHTNHSKSYHAQLLEQCSGAEMLSARWRKLVSEYSSLAITFPSDRLPALMGIAKPMLDASPTRIIAGCWEAFLFHDLLWSTSYDWGRSSTKAEPRAPSWSWMSTIAPVSYQSKENSDVAFQATLHDIQVDESKGIDDVFKWSASLTISAFMVPVILGDNPSHSSYRYIAPDIEYEGKHLRWTSKPDVKGAGGFNGLNMGDRVYCAWMATIHGHTDFALVLHCVDEEKSVYKRIAAAEQSKQWDKMGETIGAHGKMTRFTLI